MVAVCQQLNKLMMTMMLRTNAGDTCSRTGSRNRRHRPKFDTSQSFVPMHDI